MRQPFTEASLIHMGVHLCEVELADTRSRRRRGLMGRDGIEGALWLARARQVHTVGMRFAIDVAYCTNDMTVIDLVTLQPNRIGPFHWRARSVFETSAGRLAEWSVAVGDTLAIDR